MSVRVGAHSFVVARSLLDVVYPGGSARFIDIDPLTEISQSPDLVVNGDCE